MKHLIACRPGSYGNFADRMWSHLPSIGIRHVELGVPQTDEDGRQLRGRLAEHGLYVSSFQAGCSVAEQDVAEKLATVFDCCQAHGVSILFTSVKAGETDRQLVWSRLREVGDAAAARGVTLVLETHPDLATNADVALATMLAVDHPNVRINFDTANVHYYNRDVDCVTQLEKAIDFVSAVHLKDTTGGYKTGDFPALGEGVVDFPRVFEVIESHGFKGPCTMELEGTEGLERDEAAQLEYVAASAAYLKRIGVLG